MFIALAGCAPINALGQTRAPQDLSNASIEELMNVVITTASKEAEGSGSAPARVQVVTAAQIEWRGYRSLLDLLKDLPRVQGGHRRRPGLSL
jgi:outer membrane receptor for ferrienterochelin and colicin